MSIIRKIRELFIGNITQNIESSSISDATIYQAAGDIIIKNEFPPELYDLLVQISGKSQDNTMKNGDTDIIPEINSTDLYYKLLQNALEEIKNSIDNGKINYADKIINQLMATEGFEKIEVNFQTQFYYFEGIINLQRRNFDQTVKILDKIKQLDGINENYYKLLHSLSIELQDNQMLKESIDGLKNLGVPESELVVKKMQFEMNNFNFEKVVNELTDLEQIKEDFKENHEALYLLGLSYLNLNNFSLAKKYIQQSITYNTNPYKKYTLYLCDIIPIVSRRGVVFLITDIEKDLLRNRLENLISINDYFKEKSFELQEQYWGLVLNVMLFINPSDVIQEIGKMSEDMQQRNMIQLMLAEANTLLGNSVIAIEIYKNLYEKYKSEELLIKIITKYDEEKNYESIKGILDGIPFEEFDSSGFIIGMYFKSFEKQNEYEAAYEKLKKLEEQFPHSPLLYESAAVFFYEKDRLDLAKEYIKKSIDLLKEDNNDCRIIIAQSCRKLGYYQEAIEVLEPLKDSSIKITQMYAEFLLQSGKEEHLDEAEKIIESLLRKDNTNLSLIDLKAEISLLKNNHSSALNPLIESFENRPSIYAAYNITAIKLQSRDLDNIEIYIDYLVKTENPNALIMSAVGLFLINKFEFAEEISFKAVLLLDNQFDENIYLQYVMLHFQHIQQDSSQEVKIEFESVQSDTVVELIDNAGQLRQICINANKNLIKEEGKLAINCEQYSKDSIIAVRLLGKKVNQLVKLNGIEYLIKSIINKNVYTFRYCLDQYTTNCPDSKALFSVPISKADPFTPLIPFLSEGKESSDFLFRQYNFEENPIGIPIASLVKKDYKYYPSMLQELLIMKEQPFYAGEVHSFEQSFERIILSLSSIVLLKFLGCLDKVLQLKSNIYVTENIYKKVKDIFAYLCETGKNVVGTMGIDKDGRPYYLEKNEEQREMEISFWREILLFIEELNILQVDTNLKLNKDLDTSVFVDDFELEFTKITNIEKDIIICDDLFIRKVAITLKNGISTTNLVGLLEQVYSEKELIDIVLKLSSQQYLYCFNEQILLHLIDYVSKRPLIVGPGTDSNKLTTIIRNSLSHPFLFKEYIPILRNVIYRLEEGILITNSDFIIEEFIKEIKLAVCRYKIPSKVFLDYLLIPSGLDERIIQDIIQKFNRF